MKPPLLLVVYNHASVLAHLPAPAGPAAARPLVVELAPRSLLAFAVGYDVAATFPGIAAILDGKTRPADLAVPLAAPAVDLVLAPGSPVSPAALGHALGALRDHPDRPDDVRVLVEVGDLSALVRHTTSLDHVAVAWDVAEAPHADAEDALRRLREHGVGAGTTWRGFRAYHHGGELAADERSRLAGLVGVAGA